MTRQHPHDAPAPARGGFTIVEVMVAIVILSIGILGLAATAGVVVRQMTGAVHQSVASNVAYSRMERIRSGNCVAMKDSSGPAAGVKTRNVTEFWKITGTSGSHMLLVKDSIVYIVRGKQKFQKYITEYPCDPI
jgi:prepilin-type N-terminal cleavage/methylation domain-containing protein